MVLDPVNGVVKGEGGCLLLQHVRSSAVEEHDWEALVRDVLQKETTTFFLGHTFRRI